MTLKFIYSQKATKFCEILLLTVCTVVKSKGKISQNFVAFSKYMNFKYPSSIYSQNIAQWGLPLFEVAIKILKCLHQCKKKLEQKLFKCAFIKFRASLGIIDSIWWKHTPSNVMAFRNGWKVSYFDGNSISRFLMKPDLCLRSMYISVTSVVEFWGQDSTGRI